MQKQRLGNSRRAVAWDPGPALPLGITDVDTTAISKLTKSAEPSNGTVVIVRFMAKTQQPRTMRRNELMTDSLVRCEL